MAWFSFIPIVGNLVTKIFGDKEQRDQHKANMTMLEMENISKQLDINAIEAGHTSLFVAGWRPFVGWVGAIAYGLAFIIDILVPGVLILSNGDFATVAGTNIVLTQLHTLPFLTYIGVLSAMLGLGMGIRSFEKYKGISNNSIKNLQLKDRDTIRKEFFKLYKKRFGAVTDEHERLIDDIFSKL